MELHETLIGKFNSFISELSDYIVQYLNITTSLVKGTEINFSQIIESSDRKLNKLLSKQINNSNELKDKIKD